MSDLCNEISRRTFLGTSAALSAGGLMLSGLSESAAAASSSIGKEWEPLSPIKVYVVYLGLAAGWPSTVFDPNREIEYVFTPHLDKVTRNLGDVEFIGGDLIPNNVDVTSTLLPKIAEQKADAILIVHFSCANTDASFAALASTGLPTAIYARPYAGHEWTYVAELQREGIAKGMKIISSFSRDLNEVERLVGLLRVPKRMRDAKLIVLGTPGCAAGTPAACNYDMVKEKFGTQVIHITPDEFVEIHKTIPEAEAVAEAEEYWIKMAQEIREPSREEIIKSCKTYFATKKLMKMHNARALCMKCLGGIPIDILGYPCLGFSRIIDDGAIGACEADMDSTLNMMMMLYGTGLPGFITDPVMDYAKNAVIHAHCVSATKMAGPQSARLPFIIRSHLEDNLGASLRVIVDRDINREVTWTKLCHNDFLLVVTGKLIEDYNLDDRGCRTRMVCEVTSSTARELFEKWGGNVIGRDIMSRLHRTLFYGNHMDTFQDIARLMGLKFMVEGKDWA